MLFRLLLCLVVATAQKTVRDANRNWLTVGRQSGSVLLGNVPTHYPEWHPMKDVEQSGHGRSPNQAKHGAYPRGKPYTPRLRNHKRRQPPGNNL